MSTDHNEAMRLADELAGDQLYGLQRRCRDEAAALLRQQAELIAELQSAHDVAVEIAAQYAAERDRLREEAERLSADGERYRYLRDRSPREVLCNNGPSAGCWIDCEDEHSELILLTGDDADAAIDAARTTHKETE